MARDDAAAAEGAKRLEARRTRPCITRFYGRLCVRGARSKDATRASDTLKRSLKTAQRNRLPRIRAGCAEEERTETDRTNEYYRAGIARKSQALTAVWRLQSISIWSDTEANPLATVDLRREPASSIRQHLRSLKWTQVFSIPGCLPDARYRLHCRSLPKSR